MLGVEGAHFEQQLRGLPVGNKVIDEMRLMKIGNRDYEEVEREDSRISLTLHRRHNGSWWIISHCKSHTYCSDPS